MKKLYFKQKVFKITDHYEVYNEHDEIEYYVDQDFRFMGFSVNVTDAGRNYVFNIEREVFSLLPKFYINFKDGSNLIMKSRLSFLKKVIDVESEDLQLRLEGDIWDYNFRVYNQDNEIAFITKKLFSWGDTYEMTILDSYYSDVILAITIGVDCIKDAQRAASSTSSDS
ncbi:MAG: LURP-one-related family protein [Erysipelotrichaceae bacterium]|jgi:uncharacterized protein YxjI|nr:LURP-one-related family protein [Bacillota bacterium]NLP22365.1 hypothetical protein [Erysipelotrichaceae bacterium]